MKLPTIVISEEKKCAECGQSFAAPNGLCMSCTTKAIKGKKMRSAQGAAVAARFDELKRKHS